MIEKKEDPGKAEENLTAEERLEREIRQMEKAKKNLVYVGIMSVIMLFGGLSSAYIVSMGDSFWVKFPMPPAFWISTGLIAVSSITLQLAYRFTRQANYTGLKLMITLTLLLGLGFVYFQFRGYGQLIDKGAYAVSNRILVTDGKYGDYYEVKYKGDFIEVDGNDFLLKGKKMTETEISAYQHFMSQFLEMRDSSGFTVRDYGKDFEIYFHNQPLSVENHRFLTADSVPLPFLDCQRLQYLAIHVRDRRGDFFLRGKIGKDFHIYFKGEELQYKNRNLYKDGRVLTGYLQIKSMESPDTASSYLYILTFMHLVHIIITIMVMFRTLIHSFTGDINQANSIRLKTAAIFWHFLGLLWLYLLLFLLFIH